MLGNESQLQKVLVLKNQFRRWAGVSATHGWGWDRERGLLESVLPMAPQPRAWGRWGQAEAGRRPWQSFLDRRAAVGGWGRHI